MDFSDGRWLNEPRSWRVDGDRLVVTTDQATDFWRETHYGFVRDSGHFLGFRTRGDFTAEIRVQGRYEELYDQAGMMIRVDERHWVKAGIELSDGEHLLGSVLTGERSDWATGRYSGDPNEVRIRATVTSGVLRLQSSADGVRWPLLRLAPFPQADAYLVGPFCCTPERAGLEVRFSDFRVSAPDAKALHDLS